MAQQQGVYLEFAAKPGESKGERFKLRFKHAELRQLSEMVKLAYKDPSATIDALLQDPFGGWPYLLQYAMKGSQPDLTVDEASDLIDRWVDDGNEFVGIRRKLQDALVAAGYLPKAKKDPDTKNDQSPDPS
jgi:hypothetical protein